MHTRYSDRLDVEPRRFSGSRNRRRKSGSVLVMFIFMLPFLLVPFVGLAIDVTVMYSVKAKLQTAVDGGAIAAAQSLNSGLTFAVQQVAAETTAKQFIEANTGITAPGVTGYWGSKTLNYTDCDATGTPATVHTQNCVIAAEDNTNKRRTVTVAASVNVPLLFLRIFGFSTATVASKGTAARRDVVLVLVIDRSSSMTSQIALVSSSATLFVKQFQSARDKLGLVVFGGSAIIAYPYGDWGKDVIGGAALAGPDTSFKDSGDSAAKPNMITSLSNIVSASNTGTAEGLMLAYKELVAAGQPGALNVIVLFTDGKPNGLTANFNTSDAAYNAVRGTSTCKNQNTGTTHLLNSATSMTGWMALSGTYHTDGPPKYPPASGSPANLDGHGIFGLMQTDQVTNTTVTDWLAETTTEPTLKDSSSSSPSHGCYYLTVNKNPPPPLHDEYASEDITIPKMDIYGNSTLGVNQAPYTTNDYKLSEIWSGSTDPTKNVKECMILQGTGATTPTTIDLTRSNDPCQIGLASWNAADMAARQIHADPNNLKPVIYSIGYQGNGGVDDVLMKRMSNVASSVAPTTATNTVYDSTKPQGMYISVATNNDIAPAFQTVLAEILRLSM
jgi:Flp pilus assembly protein TadG